ncbi:Hypothetical Protein RRSL_00952 [Ralstonia solanacearum UW551]|uniref:Secreted protein n=1 Tax=Ralstonia solanacearum (strain UW551) TaxID=342110 RepID=A0AB33V990_RALSU|nr:Hypothetical Protein RRSL_00952 [Ralstonia solanacearum UW551]
MVLTMAKLCPAIPLMFVLLVSPTASTSPTINTHGVVLAIMEAQQCALLPMLHQFHHLRAKPSIVTTIVCYPVKVAHSLLLMFHYLQVKATYLLEKAKDLGGDADMSGKQHPKKEYYLAGHTT